MVFIQVYHCKAWLVDDYRDPALETNITTTVTGAATRDPLFEPDPKNPKVSRTFKRAIAREVRVNVIQRSLNIKFVASSHTPGENAGNLLNLGSDAHARFSSRNISLPIILI